MPIEEILTRIIETINNNKPWLWEVRASGQLARCQIVQVCRVAGISSKLVVDNKATYDRVVNFIKLTYKP